MHEDPLIGFKYALEIGGTLIGTFRDVSVAPSAAGHKIAENLSAVPTDRAVAQPAFRMVARPAEAPASSGTPVTRKIPGRLKWVDVTVRSMARPGDAARPPMVQFKWADTILKSTARPPIDKMQQKVRGAAARGIKTNMDPWVWRKMVETGAKLNQTALKWQPVTLEIQGFVASGASVAKSDETQSGRITLVNGSGATIARWQFENGWPSKFTGPSPKSDSSGTTFTLQVDGLRRV